MIAAVLLGLTLILLTRKREFLTATTPAAPTRPAASPAPSQPNVSGTDVTTIASLERKYKQLTEEYKRTIDLATSKTDVNTVASLTSTITRLNTQIAAVLEQLVAKLAAEEAKGSKEFANKRVELTKRLEQIKKDYTGLVSSTDQLTTLRRIRAYEESKANSGLKGYLIAFGVAVSLLIVVIFYKMFQPVIDLATSPIATTPAMTPSFIQ